VLHPSASTPAKPENSQQREKKTQKTNTQKNNKHTGTYNKNGNNDITLAQSGFSLMVCSASSNAAEKFLSVAYAADRLLYKT